MVRRVINIVYKEVRGLHQAAYVLAFFAFGSQLLALVRDRLLAHQFGAGYDLDLYYAAFRIPDLMYVVFASTLSVYVLIPFVARARQSKDGDRAASAVLSQVFSLFLILYSVLAVMVAVLAPSLVEIFFPNFATDDRMVTLLRIMLLQPFFLGVSSLFGVVTQLGHRFVLFAVSPLIYNLGIITGLIFFYPITGLSGLALGVVLGAVGHMFIQWPFVRQSPLAFSFVATISRAQMFEILRTSIPRALTLSVNQIVLLVFVSIASTMAIGSVSVYQFAYNLQSVPLAIIGASYSVAAFPALAELYAKKKFDTFNLYIVTALRHMIFWSLPVIALIIVLRAQLVRVVLGSGAFDWGDTRLTAAVLALFSFSLLAQAINLLAIRTFYAGGITRTPLIAACVGASVSIGSAYGLLHLYYTSASFVDALTRIMRVAEVPGGEVLVLGLGYTIGVMVQSVFLLTTTKRTFATSFSWIWKQLAHGMAAALVAALSAYGALQFVVDGINPNTFIGIFIQGGIAGAVGVVGAVLVYVLLGTSELQEIVSSFQRKLFKTDIVAPEETIL